MVILSGYIGSDAGVTIYENGQVIHVPGVGFADPGERKALVSRSLTQQLENEKRLNARLTKRLRYLERGRAVRLEGAELADARRHQIAAEENLGKIAELTLEKIGHRRLPLGPRGVGLITVKPNNSLDFIWEADEGGGYNLVGVYDNDQGVCREPTPEDQAAAQGQGPDAGGNDPGDHGG